MRRTLWVVAGLAILSITAALSLGIGTSSIDLTEILHPSEVALSVRLPRVLLGAVVGGALAVAGATLQAILQNPLADPYVVGVSGGAALGGVTAIALGLAGPWSVPLWAFTGATSSVLLLLALAHVGGRSDPLTLLLAGTIFNAITAAAVTFIKMIVTANQAQEILFWLLGSLGSEAPSTLVALSIYVGLATTVVLLGAGVLDLLAQGDDAAATVGVAVGPARLVLFCAAALLVGAVVAVAGMVGFVGLVVPHVARMLVGEEHHRLLPACLVGGASFLMMADAAARSSFFLWGTEIPAGAVTACIGGPFFLFLLLRRDAS